MPPERPLLECLGFGKKRSRDGSLTHYGRHGKLSACSYHELFARGEAFADGLLSSGFEPGEPVGVSLSNGIDFFQVLVGCAFARMPVVPLPIELFGGYQPTHANRLEKIRSTAGIRRIIGSGAGNTSPSAIFSAASGKNPCTKAAGDTPAIIQFTSGSTEDPRGALLSQENVASNISAIVEAVGMAPSDTVDLWLPLSHDMGLIGSLAAIASGANLRICSPTVFLADPLGWLLRFAEMGSTISPAPHFAYRLLVEDYDRRRAMRLNLSAWRVAFDGAEPIVADDLNRFQEVYGPHGFSPTTMLPVYGMAEATLALAFPTYGSKLNIHRDHQGRQYVGVGRPIGGAEVVFKPVQDHGSVFPDGAGEICFRGPSLMQGYVRPGGLITPGRDNEGFFATGDIGFERDGSLFICGRSKEVLIIRGRHYFPHELESAARASHYLENSEVIDVAAFQPFGRDEVILLIEWRCPPDDRSERVRKLGAELSRTFGIAIAAVPTPRHSIPKTTSGKVQRWILADSWNAREAAPASSCEQLAEKLNDQLPKA